MILILSGYDLFLSILVIDERARDKEKGSRESRWLSRTKGTRFGIPTIFTVYINIGEIQESYTIIMA